ncbi:MAG: hypothetical protein GY754_01250 [bacterium]|nr:hypothetical protein [bacterium]
MNGKKYFRSVVLYVLFPAVLLSLIACGGDVTASDGEKGNLRYSIATDYYVNSSLTAATLVSKITHRISVSIIDHDDVSDPGNVIHYVEDTNASVQTGLWRAGDKNSVGDVFLKVTSPGKFTILSKQGAELIDYITLTFDEAGRLEIISKVRTPNNRTFDTQTGAAIPVVEGSQVVFIPIPVTDAGMRLIGNGSYAYTADPSWMVVLGLNIDAAYEGSFWVNDGVWAASGEDNFYFIEEGSVTFTATETESGYTGTQAFSVSARPRI